MKRILLAVSLAVALFVLLAGEANAQRHGRRIFFRGYTTPHRYQMPHYHGGYRYNPYHAYSDLYPKFYGGFHSRHYTTLGVPPGDVGIRGNGFQWLPW